MSQAKAHWEDWKKHLGADHRRMAENWSFALHLDHYLDDQGAVKDRSRIQFKGRELIGKIRHKSAQITKDFYFDVRPMNLDADQSEADDARRIIEWETQHPQKFYRTIEEKVVISALAGSLGIMACDFDPFSRPSGQLTFRIVDPRNFGWTPGWANPHEINCPWVQEVRRMRLADIKAMARQGWKNTADVVPDNGDALLDDRSTKNLHEKFATVLFTYYRNDPSTKDQKIDPATPLPLDPANYYMACNVCGHADHVPDGSNLPELNGPCPKCAGQDQINLMQRVDHEFPTQQVLAYPNLRLVICAPFSTTLLYDGEAPKLRSVPYLFYSCYEHPFDAIGRSDTDYDWSAQLISDATFRMGYEQMMTSRRYWGILQGNEIRSAATGDIWSFADKDGYVFTAADIPTLQQGMKEFQGAGLPPAWPAWTAMVQNVLTRDLGTTDIDLGASQSKRIPVGTIEEMVKQAEVPVAKHIEKLQDARSMFLSVVLDYAIATGADERVIGYMSDDGTYALKSLRYSDVPAAHIIVTGKPEVKKMALDEAQAMMTMLSAPDWAREFLAEEMGINRARLQKLEQKKAEWERAHPQPPLGGGPGSPGMGSPAGMEPGAPPLARSAAPMVGAAMQ